MIDAGNPEFLTDKDGKMHQASSYRIKSFIEKFPYLSQTNIGNKCLFPHTSLPVSKSSFSAVSPAVPPYLVSPGQQNAYNDFGRPFNGQMMYKTPSSNDNPSSGSNHLCPVCEKTFRASSLLDIHMRVHVGAKPFVCPVCGHRATQKGNLKLHMRKHHGTDLPPHIDIVPDSGIWGHPRENQLVLGPHQSSDMTLDDLTGKRRQVAQAVSSMLDEEIVELIKKCQNNVGQGMTGRITESLEDFIHIAKNKSVLEIGRDNCGSTGRSSVCSSGSRMKIRHTRNNLKFVPYIPKKKGVREGWNDHQQHSSSVGDVNSFSFKNLARSPTLVDMDSKSELINSEMTTQSEYINSSDNFVDIRQRITRNPAKNLEEVEPEPRDVCGIFRILSNGDNSNEIAKDFCKMCPSVNKDRVEGNDNTYSSSNEVDEKTSKDEFMLYLGLASINSPHLTNKAEQESGLNPFLDYMARKLSVDEADAFPTPSSRCKPQWLNIRKRLSNETDEKVEQVPTFKRGSVGKEKYLSNSGQRASPSVLNMLRQTVLNSVEHKLALPSAPLADSNYIEINENSKVSLERLDRLNKIDQPYANLAMQSLANIGKSMLSLEESQETKIELGERKSPNDFLRNYGEHNPSNIKGNLHSILLSLQEDGSSGYQCCFCPKWFKYRSVLEIHMRSHTGERPYKCPYCEYAGTQHNCLKLHIQRHHPREYMMNHADALGNKGPGLSISSDPPAVTSAPGTTDSSSYRVSCFSPVNCPICGRVSPSPGYLKIHMRSHKKSLDHVCHICGRGFKEYWYLSTHLKTHERELRSVRPNTKSQQPINPLLFFPNGASSPSPRLLDEMRKLNGACPDFFSGDVLNGGLLKDSIELLKENSRRINSFTTGNSNNSNRNQASPSSVNFERAISLCPSDFSVKKSGPLSHDSAAYDAKSSPNDFVDCQPAVAVSHSSRRKAACPSKITTEPYPNVRTAPYVDEKDATLYKRKCKPRKVYHGTYLAPPLSKISFARKEPRDDRRTENFALPYSINTTDHSYDDELPLDLSCTQKEKRENTLPSQSDKNNNVDDTPLNLSKT